jgi:hypothetical protein
MRAVKDVDKERIRIFIHDLTLLLSKFAHSESFSVDSGGGSAEHNLKLIPFLIQSCLFLMDEYNESSKREIFQTTLSQFLNDYNAISLKVDQSGYFNLVLSILLINLEEWKQYRLNMLKILLIQKMSAETFQILQPILIYFALVDEIQRSIKTSSSVVSVRLLCLFTNNLDYC